LPKTQVARKGSDAIIAAVDTLTCPRCGASRETEDNFCRRCGHQLTVDVPAGRSLPAVQPQRLPARSQSLPPSLVGSVALLAVGTGIEWLARRMAGTAGRSVARAATRALIGRERLPANPVASPPSTPSTVNVDEFIYVRKVELRR
jgi:hypothetical protein